MKKGWAVTPALRDAVLERDGGCVAPRIDPEAGPCTGYVSIDHVQDGYGRMGRRANSDMAHCVSICTWHHVFSGWATSHRPELRIYLAEREAA